MTPRAALLRAAQLLEEDAECLKRSHTLNGEWIAMSPEDERAKADCVERMALAAILRLLS